MFDGLSTSSPDNGSHIKNNICCNNGNMCTSMPFRTIYVVIQYQNNKTPLPDINIAMS